MKKILYVLAILLGSANLARAQVRMYGQVVPNLSGQLITNAKISVCSGTYSGSSTALCTTTLSLATIYSDPAGSVPQSNPITFTTGKLKFFAAPGTYSYSVAYRHAPAVAVYQHIINVPGFGSGCLPSSNSSAACGVSDTLVDRGTSGLELGSPDPWADITVYGARAVASFQTTATTTASSTSVTLARASSFVNGDGITILGAGATETMSTPSAPSVTPSLPASNMGNGSVVRAPAGSVSASYEIVADNGSGGLTAASAAGSTNAAQTLGQQQATGCAITRAYSGSNNYMEVTSCSGGSAISLLAAGARVDITRSSDNSFNGTFRISSTSGGDLFMNYIGEDVRAGGEGAGTFATGATLTWYPCNHLTWKGASGVFIYHVYELVGRTYTYLGDSYPNYNNGTMWFDDYGSTISGNTVAPWYVPTTAPTSAQNDFLTTTIAARAGTTRVTLKNAATNAVSGATAIFDNAPALLAATKVANTHTVYIPPGTFVINSPFTMPVNGTTNSYIIRQAGNLTLNAPFTIPSSQKWFCHYDSSDNPHEQFGLSTGCSLTGSAIPLVYSGGSGNQDRVGIFLDGLSVSYSHSNGSQDIVLYNVDFFHLSHMTVTNHSGNYVGIQLLAEWLFDGQPYPRSIIDDSAFLGQEALASTEPVIQFINYNGAIIKGMMQEGQGIAMAGAGVATARGWDFSDIYNQGTGEPMVTVADLSGADAAPCLQPIHLTELYEDTATQPILATLCSNPLTTYQGNVIIDESNGEPDTRMVTGSQILNLTVLGQAIGNGVLTGPVGQNNFYRQCTTGADYISGYYPNTSSQTLGFCDNAMPDLRQGLFYEGWTLPQMAAPTATKSSGGSITAGTYYFAIQANTPEGGFSQLSPASASVTTSSGTQTITVNWTAATNIAGNKVPGVTYNLWSSTNGTSFTSVSGQAGLTGTSAKLTTTPASGGLYVGNSTAVSPSIGPNGVFSPNVELLVASGTASMPTGSITAGGCSTVAVSASGVTPSDKIIWSPAVQRSAVSGYGPSGGLHIDEWPTSNHVNFEVCNNTSTPITPGPLTINWSALQ